MKAKVPGALGVPVQPCCGFRDTAAGPARATDVCQWIPNTLD